MIVSLALALLLPAAQAGKCDSLLARAEKDKGTALAASYAKLAACDKELAEQHYRRFMSSANDLESLVALSKSAIASEVWNPVWQQLDNITDYDIRDQVAQQIGAACSENEKIVPFLQGAYFGLKDIKFQQWSRAYEACEADALTTWLDGQVAKPPQKAYDDKFSALMTAYVDKRKAEALPTLAQSAIAAAEAGPYDAILMKMDEAVATDLGGTLSDEDRQALETALITVARAVTPEKARSVADRLATAGSRSAAAKLLPSIYPDRVRGGGFIYGAAAVEAGECKGAKTVVLHVSEVSEPGKRWLILEDTEGPMRAFKPRLKKCESEAGDWPVSVTPEPVMSGKDIDAWVNTLEATWAAKGYDVKVAGEKGIALD
ncbi:MAG: hypothetical protein VX265_08055 [Myxococcota bacterium]|nr:hypothetical protein [Myxococcota bacterium]